MRRLKYFFPIFLIFSSCFGSGVDTRGTVKSYRDGIVFTEGGSFQVGRLSPAWKIQSFKLKAILFAHSEYRASIGVESFCGKSFDDSPLATLSNQLYYGMTKQKTKTQKTLRIDEREALRSIRHGAMDGMDVVLDTVVLKSNACVFDFVYTSKPDHYSNGIQDFETFVKGFHYIKGPRIDE